MKHSIYWKESVVLSLFVIVVASCAKPSDPQPVRSFSKVFLVQASPDAPAMDIYFDNQKAQGLLMQYPLATSTYLNVDTGVHAFKFTASGTTTALTSHSQRFVEKQLYTLITYDSLSKIKTMSIRDEYGNYDAGRAFVRFLHLSPNGPAVDVYFNDLKIFSNRQFADNVQDTVLSRFKVSEQTYVNILMRLASTGDTLASLNNVTLLTGGVYTIVAKGFSGGTAEKKLGIGLIRQF